MAPKLSNRPKRSRSVSTAVARSNELERQFTRYLRTPESLRRKPVRKLRASRGVSVAELARYMVFAGPMERVELERKGLPATVVSDLAQAMAVPRVRLFEMMALPRATMEQKISDQEVLTGLANRRALNLLQLLGHTREILEDSTLPEARSFDAAQWLGRWIETPQPALGGRKPADLLDTEEGAAIVDRALGTLRSGSYL